MVNIQIARSDAAIRRCYGAILELRPTLSEHDYIQRVKTQVRSHGYTLVYLCADSQVVSVAGYRVAEFLAWHRIFYVDDLVTIHRARHRGYGGQLLDWLLERAVNLDCHQFHLDSGPQRHDAHRLYMSRKLQLSAYHFSKVMQTPLSPPVEADQTTTQKGPMV